jgi:hypothetical protein
MRYLALACAVALTTACAMVLPANARTCYTTCYGNMCVTTCY